MTPRNEDHAATGDTSEFVCSWKHAGIGAAWVLVAGDLDAETAPRLSRTLVEALRHARLVVLNLRELTLIDSAGVQAIVDAAARARAADARLIVAQGPPHVDAVFRRLEVHAQIELVSAEAAMPAELAPAAANGAGSEHNGQTTPVRPGTVRPLDNPVNASVVTARVMAIPDRQLWLHSAAGVVQRAWAPEGAEPSLPPETSIELYLDADDEINGWRDPVSGLAVNQRHLDRLSPPADGSPMVCQGNCGVVWQAPAAALLEEHDERCLTCSGRLAAG